jgi:hypothetical protein
MDNLTSLPYITKFLDYGSLGIFLSLALWAVYMLFKKNQQLEEDKAKTAGETTQDLTIVIKHIDDNEKAILIALENLSNNVRH